MRKESENYVSLLGKVAKAPEISYTKNKTPRCAFRLETTDGEYSDFHSIVIWGPDAEEANKLLKLDGFVRITGCLKTRSWKDARSGEKKYITEVNVREIIYL